MTMPELAEYLEALEKLSIVRVKLRAMKVDSPLEKQLKRKTMRSLRFTLSKLRGHIENSTEGKSESWISKSDPS